MKTQILFCLTLISQILYAQAPDWEFSLDSVANLSSARTADLNGDGIKDIVFGAGTDGVQSNNGIAAVNGLDGSLLWKRATRNEVFGSAIFKDITSDGILDVFIAGRQAQLLAINGANGALIWDFFPYGTNPIDSGWYNFYNPSFVADFSNDGIQDILVSNGGDHAAPAWETNRPAGKLLLINSVTGAIISQAVVPDSAEIYCSPVVADLWNDGNPYILYGTGGETLGGHFYACRLSQLAAGSLAGSIELAADSELGYIAPASVVKETNSQWRIFIQSYGGKVHCIDGATFTELWSHQFTGTESSSALTLGNFTGSLATDAFAVLYKGEAPSFSDYYQVMLDGETGAIQFIDSIGTLHFASANALDFNNDGRDEVIISTNTFNNGGFRNSLQLIDFTSSSVQELINPVTGVNLASTPLIADVDSDQQLELFILTRKDSLNPSAWKGVTLRKYALGISAPNSGIAWGAYMGSNATGHYYYLPVNCGFGAVAAHTAGQNPTCNGLANGAITPVVNPNSGPITYVWSTGSTGSALTDLIAGPYSLRVTNGLGCYEDLNFNLQNPYVISFGGTMPPTCPGATNGMATVSSSGCQCMFSTCTFLWDNGVVTKSNVSLPEGWSKVTINHPDGCVVVDSIFMPIAAPAVESAVLQHESCFNLNDGSIELVESAQFAPISYIWSNGENGNAIDALAPGFYWVKTEDTRGCADSLSFVINEQQPVTFTATGIPVSCSGVNNGGIDVQASGGVPPYSWVVNGTNSSVLSQVFASGAYTVQCVDENGCSSETQEVIITTPAPIAISYSFMPESTPNTLSGSITAHVTGGIPPYTFLWNDVNAQTDSMAVYLNSGWYELWVNDAAGCSISDSVLLEAPLNTPYVSAGFTVYPNPVQSTLHFSTMVDCVRVITLQGQILLEAKHCSTINMNTIAAGFYFVEYFLNNSNQRRMVQVMH
jgi:hypothetical protein